MDKETEKLRDKVEKLSDDIKNTMAKMQPDWPLATKNATAAQRLRKATFALEKLGLAFRSVTNKYFALVKEERRRLKESKN